MLYEITKLISFEQINKLFYFNRMKKRTLFPKKKKDETQLLHTERYVYK
jgi:hypothetical protein